ncbi:MAG: CHAT domain-containing protein [Acidobacteriota bacterium]|nr:MAG: CHAT domain-containing protein [Acidobacteriota bacterium]
MASAGTSVYGEIEIGLHRAQPEVYEVEMRVIDPETQGEIAPARGQAHISSDELLMLQQDPAKYAETLTDQLFETEDVRKLFDKTKSSFESRGLKLRVRLLIGQSAPELQALRWELLLDPETKKRLTTSEQILFSRFMLSRDWRVIRLRPKRELKALIAVSAPTDLTQFGLAEVDKAGETARAREALQGVETSVIDKPLTLNNLVEVMRGGIDILYLVSHGAMPKGKEPCLFLQNEEGKTARVTAGQLAERINELPEAPRLIVLASCESAGDGTPEAQSSLAPRLAEAGVPAVLAMQGKISMETVKQAMPVFFSELLKDGQIDRAMAVARGNVREQPDNWMPVLFLRLKNGRIWYEPGFSGESKDEFSKWKSICSRVRTGEFIPILGPDIAEELLGGTREMASRLAEMHGFPLAENDRADLAKVTQYISTKEDRNYAQDAVVNQFLAQLAQRVDEKGSGGKNLKELISLALERCKSNPDNAFTILSQLGASIFLNASPDTLLIKSIESAGKKPEAVFGDWRRTGDKVPKEPEPENAMPSAESPWVYQVFGVFGKRETLVLTEDDFLDYLIATSTDKLMPKKVRGSLLQNSLLFLGFQLDDIRFRVLFRLIMTMQGTETLRNYSHVGVQINPDEHRFADVERARKYIESYFQEGRGGAPSISIYWGTAADFLKELRRQLSEMKTDEAAPVAKAADDDWL